MLLEARAQMSDEDDENEADRENLAIPEYGGEDIDEAENEYGSSDEEEEDDHRYREAIEELQAATRNIKEDQLDDELRDKLEGFTAAIKELRDRFGPMNAQSAKWFEQVESAAESDRRRIELKFHEVEEALIKLRRQDQENRE
jgi:small-conductance mechanosensitive channel